MTTATATRRIGIGGFNISTRAKQLVAQVLESNRITAGPMTEAFEREIARAHNCQFAIMCNSGTSALHAAVACLKEQCGWSDGDEVLVPALTFIASSNVVLYAGLTPVFVDVDPVHYTIDPAQIERHITSRTRAIMPVHVAGQAAEMPAIVEIARKHDLRVIEDAAESMFADIDGQPVGSFGDVACFSTYAAHIISTGVGGLCTTNDADLCVMLKSFMNHGRDAIYIRMDDDRDAHGEALRTIVDRRFSFVRLGHSFRATELEAALGIAELEQLTESLDARSRNAQRLTDSLSLCADRLQLPHARPGYSHRFMFYPVTILDPSIHRDDLVMHLEGDGIETRPMLPLLNQPIYRKRFGDLSDRYPIAHHIYERSFYVGSHPELTNDDVDYVVDSFHRFLG